MTDPFSIQEAILQGDDCPKYTARDMQAYAAQAVAAERELWQLVIFDGYRVLQALDEKAKKRTSHESVSDVLDAVASLLKTHPLT